jgi:hypothetical protein
MKMNKKIRLLCSVAACYSLAAMADGVDLEKDFSGLNIQVEIVGSGSDGGGTGSTASSGPQALKVSNNDKVAVSCELQPGAAEAQDSTAPAAIIEPGKYGTLRVPGKYTGAPLKAKLLCKPQ